MNYSFKVPELARAGASAVNLMGVENAKVLVVDDHSFSRMTAADILSLDGYEVIELDDSTAVMDCVKQNSPDLILLNVTTPQLDGFEVCKCLKQDESACQIPVILVTVSEDRRSRLKCLEAGGDDCLTKPLDRLVLLTRVRSLIQQKRLNEDLDQTEQVLFTIAEALESRHSTGNQSSIRLSSLAQSFGRYLELQEAKIQSLRYAAYLHDIGTIGIPDAVMQKKGQLTLEERELINQHVVLGEKICQPLRNRYDVLPIIRHHHERWDGSGYPDGLVGEEIPLLAQIFQILDIYTALTSERPYKPACSLAQAIEIIADEAERGWRSPHLTRQFIDFICSTSGLAA